MDPVYGAITLRLLAALGVGALIGFERSYRGRPAGFRTHALVCLSTALLMLVTVYESRWVPELDAGRLALDPTRMAQGIMTGIGFLGAGVIMKEGLSVRGLTTAASIWMTAAIGILIGIGFYFPAAVATALTIAVLSLFHWIEARLPAQFYAQFAVRFAQDAPMAEEALRELVSAHGFSIANLNYRFDAEAGFYEYQMVIRSTAAANAGRLAMTLSKLEGVLEFRLSPTGR
ncbi:MAG: MgtC/SapB family protein [Burkholderiales bacterium]|nr:MgtC/SapB family protein [Burkholderiales bacterium]PZN03034.1 MAG: magnesium transporter MgtC [Pseudomonadota bacterium]